MKPPDRTRFAKALKERFFLRVHMTLILGATFAAGLLVTRLLLAVHLNDLRTRYIIAVCAAYLVFLAAIKLWLAYAGYRTRDDGGVDFTPDGVDFFASNLSDAPSFVGGGGSGGGGGATGSWGDAAPSSSSVGLDVDDGCLVVLIAALVFAIAVAAIYVIYAAPVILSEAAFEVALAAALARRAKRISSAGWVGSVFRATVLPFAVVLLFAGATGWYAHKRCPSATRLREAVQCVRAGR